jgi:hypothetical protein
LQLLAVAVLASIALAGCGEGDYTNLDEVYLDGLTLTADGVERHGEPASEPGSLLDGLSPPLTAMLAPYVNQPSHVVQTSCAAVYTQNMIQVAGYDVVTLRFYVVNSCDENIRVGAARATSGSDGETPTGLSPAAVGIFRKSAQEVVYCARDDSFACSACGASPLRRNVEHGADGAPAEWLIPPDEAALISYSYRSETRNFAVEFDLYDAQGTWKVKATFRPPKE